MSTHGSEEPRRPAPDPAARRTPVDRWWPYFAVVVAVLAANIVSVTGLTLADPIVARGNVEVSLAPGFLPGDYSLDPNDGYTTQALGAGAARQLLDGEIPWWNSYAGLGAPLVAEMQSAALFPGTVLQVVPGGKLILRMLLEILAGVATVAVVRGLGVRSSIAAGAGVVFALNGAIAWFHHATFTPIAFLPMLIWGVERAYRASVAGRRAGYLVTAAALALSLYAGFPETAYLSGLLAAAWCIWRFVRGEGRRALFAFNVAIGGVLGLLLSAPAVLPFAAYLSDGADVGGHSDVFARLGLSRVAFGSLFTPYAYGPIGAFSGSEEAGLHLYTLWSQVGGYTTIALLFLAVAAIGGRRHSGLRWVLAGWTAVVLAKTFSLPVVTDVVNLIPGITVAAFYRYAYPVWIFALVILAALALQDVLDKEMCRLRVLALVIGLREGLWMIGRVTDSRIEDMFLVSYVYAGLSIVAVLVLVLMARRAWPARVAVGVLAGALALEAVVFAAIPTLSAHRDWEEDVQLTDFLEAAADEGALGRVYSLSDRLSPNYGTFYGVAQLNVNDLPVPFRWGDFVAERLDPGASASNFYLYDLSPPSIQRTYEAFAQHVNGYRDAAVAWVITPAGELPPVLAAHLSPVLETPTATVSELVGTRPYVEALDGGCAVTSISRTEHELSCTSEALLVRRELALEGWRVSIDGASAPLEVYDDYFQAVEVPAGEHTVAFAYRAPGGTAGLALFGVGAALTATLLILRRRESRRDGSGLAGSPVVTP